MIRGLKVTESPDWLRRQLETLGLRPINVVVDVTNYVLHEFGQPSTPMTWRRRVAPSSVQLAREEKDGPPRQEPKAELTERDSRHRFGYG